MAEGKAEPIRRLNPPELGTPPGYSQIVDVRASRIIFINFPAQADQVFRNLTTALLSVGLHGKQSRETDRLPPRHGSSFSLSGGAESFLCERHSTRGTRRNVDRGVEVVWSGFPDRDRSRGRNLREKDGDGHFGPESRIQSETLPAPPFAFAVACAK